MIPIKVVIDTNVLVSRTLTPDGESARVVNMVLAGDAVACYDRRILAEYQEVLSRPRFGFGRDEVAALLAHLTAEGVAVIPSPLSATLPDESDRPFAEVAQSAQAWLVTGNLRHYPGLDRAIAPADFLRMVYGPDPDAGQL